MTSRELRTLPDRVREWQKPYEMGKSCCAVGCTNRYSKGSGIHFYRFPRDEERRAKWVVAVARKNWAPSEHSWICSAHFVCGLKSDDPLSPDYVPSVFAHTKSPAKRRLEEGVKRFERVSLAKNRRVESGDKQEAARSLLELSEVGNGLSYCEPHSGVFTMTDLTLKGLQESDEYQTKLKDELHVVCKENKALAGKCERLEEENKMLKMECEKLKLSQPLNLTVQEPFGEKFFEDNDEKVKYYTGIPSYKTLMAVFKFVSSGITSGNRTSLSHLF